MPGVTIGFTWLGCRRAAPRRRVAVHGNDEDGVPRRTRPVARLVLWLGFRAL